MADLNSFAFTGRCTQDASVRTIASGKKILTVNVAVNTGFGDYKKTLFIKVQMWGERGEKIVSYLKKGQMIAGCGELSRSEWTSKEGKQYVDFVVDSNNIQLLSSGNACTCEKNNFSSDAELDADNSCPTF